MPDPGAQVPSGRDTEWIEDLDVLPGQSQVLQRIRWLEEEVRARPEQWRLRLELAQAYASNGDFRAAADHLRACGELVADPGVMAGVFFNLGVCCENLDRWREAASAYEQCLLLLPDLFWARFNLGTCWMRLEEWRLAAAEFRRAAAIDGSQPEVLRSLRDALVAAGMGREASEADRRLLELRGESPRGPGGAPGVPRAN